MTAEDVGEILLVTLMNDGGSLYSDWFVNRVTIKAKNVTYDFPCNRWVQNEVTMFEGKGKAFENSDGNRISSQPPPL